MATFSLKRRQQLMDAAQQKEAVSRAKKAITPEMKQKIKAMAKRSGEVSSGHYPELDIPSMANAIRQRAVAADEHLASAAEKALRFIRKPKMEMSK